MFGITCGQFFGRIFISFRSFLLSSSLSLHRFFAIATLIRVYEDPPFGFMSIFVVPMHCMSFPFAV